VKSTALSYDKYIRRIADILVDDYNLHPDDAVELIDMNSKKVINWYGSASPKLVAYQLMLNLRSMVTTVNANPINMPHVALTLGSVTALAVGVFLIAEAIKQMNAPPATPEFSYNAPVTLYT
jgi:hypothetical protein